MMNAANVLIILEIGLVGVLLGRVIYLVRHDLI